MSERSKRKHVSKRLLVAAIGVASVSYMGTQSGCAADQADAPDSADGAAYDDEVEVAASEQAVTLAATAAKATDVAVRPKLPPVGNLVPPPYDVRPVRELPIKIRVPIPVGNLMAPPIDVRTLGDIAIKTGGN